jgi:hypothetical protein
MFKTSAVYFSRCLYDALYKECYNVSSGIMADYEGTPVHHAAP